MVYSCNDYIHCLIFCLSILEILEVTLELCVICLCKIVIYTENCKISCIRLIIIGLMFVSEMDK